MVVAPRGSTESSSGSSRIVGSGFFWGDIEVHSEPSIQTGGRREHPADGELGAGLKFRLKENPGPA